MNYILFFFPVFLPTLIPAFRRRTRSKKKTAIKKGKQELSLKTNDQKKKTRHVITERLNQHATSYGKRKCKQDLHSPSAILDF